MTVDLSKARKGDRVKFRCGGEAVIDSVIIDSDAPYYGYEVFFTGYSDSSTHTKGGRFSINFDHIIDIIELIPAPFDWKDVRPGMAFKPEHVDDIGYFVGFNANENNCAVLYHPKMQINERYQEWSGYKEFLFRAPEHDIEVPQ